MVQLSIEIPVIGLNPISKAQPRILVQILVYDMNFFLKFLSLVMDK